MQIRNAVEADLAAIVEIYNSTIPTFMVTGDTEPITVASRLSWFQRHNPHYPLWVVEGEAAIAGWLGFQPFYGRPAYRSTAEVSVYISSLYQRQGLGQQLLDRAIATSPTLGLSTLLGFIFEHNNPSLQLFAKLGFERWGCLPRVAVLNGMERNLVIVGRRC